MIADFSPSNGINLASHSDFEIGTLRVRPSLREVEAGNETERLEPRVMQALVALAERPGEVISRDVLLERCWGGRIVNDDAINRCMTKLRKVGAKHDAFSIESIARVGYRLIVTDTRATSLDVPARAARTRGRGLWLFLSGAAITLAVLAGFVLWRSAPAPLSTRTPFVVVEITPAGTDEALKTFAITTVGDINAALLRNRLPTTPVERTRFEIGGVVTNEAGRTRARLTIVAIPSSTTIWTDQFDAPAGEEAGLHARIASRVASVAGAANEILERPSADFDAVTLALMIKGEEGIGNDNWNSRTGPEEAVRRSPQSAAAHANFGMGLIAASWYVPADKAESYRGRAAAEIARARELDPLTPLALIPRIILMGDTPWAARLKVASEAPVSESAYGKYAHGTLLLMTGRIDESMLLLSDAMERLGERRGRLGMLITALRAGRRDASALERTRKALLLLPSDYGLRTAQLDLVALWAEPEETLAVLDDPNRRPLIPTTSSEAYRRFALWRKGGEAGGRLAAIGAVIAAAKSGMPPDSAIPLLVRLGDLDAAFESAKAWTDPQNPVSGAPHNPAVLYFTETAPMRQDRRFIALADKLGLLKFWRDTGTWPDFCQTEPHSVCAQMQGR